MSMSMNNNNELIVAIEASRAKGVDVKSIRKQKYAPNQFYMTLSNGKQLGPVNCKGNEEETENKYNAALVAIGQTPILKSRIAA